MSSAIREWLNLGVRWIHVFAGIMWVGQTYYFTWLDCQFTKLEKQKDSNSSASKGWMVLSAGKIRGRVRGIWFGDDGGNGLGIGARVQRARCIHSCGRNLRHHHDVERVDAHSSSAAQNDCVSGSGRNTRRIARRASQVAL